MDKKKLELYNKAKKAYYDGEGIMSDLEFDELEKELGLENKSYVGTKHNGSYTVQHPCIMGSLSKIQIHEIDGIIDWEKYYREVTAYICKFESGPTTIATPKYDGCSFEVHYDNGKVSASTRGDGYWGKDVLHILSTKIPESTLENVSKKMETSHYILRGEILVKKEVFTAKYLEKFSNPRSFVSGMINRDIESTKEYEEAIGDLDVVVYDYRSLENGIWVDKDWTDLLGMKLLPLPKAYFLHKMSDVLFEKMYEFFSSYRGECEYALDGFVIKPTSEYRKHCGNPRPSDCVAIKFLPMVEPTTVVSISWNLSKANEMVPIINVSPVDMDGKKVTKCSGHNYGYLIDNKISIGTKVILSLAGDIIPFLYKVVDSSEYSAEKLCIPEGDYSYEGCHLVANLDESSAAKNKFIASARSLAIPYIGEETALKVFDYMAKSNGLTDDFFGTVKKELPSNILECNGEDIFLGVGGGKAGNNAKKAFEKYLLEISLKDIIRSCSFYLCGHHASAQIENLLLGKSYDFAHLPEDAVNWASDNSSKEYAELERTLSSMGKSIDDFKASSSTIAEDTRIPIAMTGNPTQYSSKSEFLKYNPQYRDSGSWKEIKIVFTNSLSSTTGKMKNAKKYDIETKLY